jgi:hypothetical protein
MDENDLVAILENQNKIWKAIFELHERAIVLEKQKG